MTKVAQLRDLKLGAQSKAPRPFAVGEMNWTGLVPQACNVSIGGLRERQEKAELDGSLC